MVNLVVKILLSEDDKAKLCVHLQIIVKVIVLMIIMIFKIWEGNLHLRFFYWNPGVKQFPLIQQTFQKYFLETFFNIV